MNVLRSKPSTFLFQTDTLPTEGSAIGASRPTVTQAIRNLVLQILVQSRRSSGTFVTPRPQESPASSGNLLFDLESEFGHHLNVLRLWLETAGKVQTAPRRGHIAGSRGALPNAAGIASFARLRYMSIADRADLS